MRHFALIIAGLLTACNNLQMLERADLEQGGYAHILASEYYDYAQSLKEMGYKKASERMAEKGMATLRGDLVLPEPPSAGRSEFQRDAYLFILESMKPEVKDVAGKELAHVQLLYDCAIVEVDILPDAERATCIEALPAAIDTLSDAKRQIPAFELVLDE